MHRCGRRGDERDVRSPIAVKPASLLAPGEATGFGGSGSASFPVGDVQRVKSLVSTSEGFTGFDGSAEQQ